MRMHGKMPESLKPILLPRASLRLGRRTVQLNGQDAVFVPAERLKDFYEALKASVEAGELDTELAAAAGEDAPVKRRGRKPKNS